MQDIHWLIIKPPFLRPGLGFAAGFLPVDPVSASGAASHRPVLVEAAPKPLLSFGDSHNALYSCTSYMNILYIDEHIL